MMVPSRSYCDASTRSQPGHCHVSLSGVASICDLFSGTLPTALNLVHSRPSLRSVGDYIGSVTAGRILVLQHNDMGRMPHYPITCS